MSSTKKTKETIKQGLRVSASPETRDRIWREVLLVQEQSRKTDSVFVRPDMWRTLLKTKTARFAVAAAIVFIVIGGITFWPSHGKWWLGPSAVWGREIIAKLEKIEALVYRAQSVSVGRFGSTHVSGAWYRYYEAEDRSRVERYFAQTDEDTYGPTSPDSELHHVTYKVSDGNDLIQHDVSYEHQCYKIRIKEDDSFKLDPMKLLLFKVKLLENADRILGTATFEGRECIGFEISADKYGKNPEGWTNRIWLDVQTKLPVRIEMHGLPKTGKPMETYTSIQDQFEYYAQVPAAMFEPDIPDGFINADPDEIRAAKTAQKKGPMLYADVPVGLKDKIATALMGVKTTVYRGRNGSVKDGDWLFTEGERIYNISEYDWRIDYYSDEQVQMTTWYVTDKDDWGKTSFDFNDRNFRLTKTTVHFSDRSYREQTFGNRWHPDNPMDWIIFLAGEIDKADRFFESRQIDGIECFGFELSAKKYGDNPDTSIRTLWFDRETMLPVRVEDEDREETGPSKTVLDQFEWNAELPADTFVPLIPEGFMNSQPDENRAAGEKKR